MYRAAHLPGAGVWHVLTRDRAVLPDSHILDVYRQVEWGILEFLLTGRAWPHFDRYSFWMPPTTGGWVELGGWLYTDELHPWSGHHPSTNRARRRVTSLTRQTRSTPSRLRDTATAQLSGDGSQSQSRGYIYGVRVCFTFRLFCHLSPENRY